ncbi:putative exported protein [Minicystis rosea]|nr:putative exported protein [Minicystis rosea]
MPTKRAPAIPDPRLQTIKNLTPFALFQCDKMGVGRRFYDTVTVKGTFDLKPGCMELAREQAPVLLADDYWDLETPERSSVKRAGDAVLIKPSTDVILTGSVHTPAGKALREWDAAVLIEGRRGKVIDYSVQVTGPRVWRYTSTRGFSLTDPEPTEEVPIRYELAYGGAYLDPRNASPEGDPKWIVHEPNPSGTGFCDERALSPNEPYRAPQWQSRLAPVTSLNHDVPVCGFGPISRPWSSRLRYQGTCDDAWEQENREAVAKGLPADYPADFDARYFQCAHPSLIAPEHLAGDEHLALGGIVAGEARFVTELPGIAVAARLLDGSGAWHDERMPLDTVHIDLDAGAVHLCFRLTLDQARDILAAVIYTTEAT